MGKVDLKRSLYFKDEVDERERDMYLKELGESVHNYIKTGAKNSQLDDLVALEQDFQEQYEKRFNIEQITKMISESSRHKLLKNEYLKDYEKELSPDEICEKKDYNYVVKKTSDMVIDVTVQIINENLSAVLRDAVYLSHMNMLYELYEREEKLKREEREFEKMSNRFRKMAEITKKLSEKRRMELEEIEQQLNISREELTDTLNGSYNYFNIRDKKEKIQISLSPKGRKYNEYISRNKNQYSNDRLNELVYKNCNKLMESFETSYERGIIYEISLDGLDADRERALKYKYNRTVQDIITAKEDVYYTKEFIVREKKVSVKKKNEENTITIPEWNGDVY